MAGRVQWIMVVHVWFCLMLHNFTFHFISHHGIWRLMFLKTYAFVLLQNAWIVDRMFYIIVRIASLNWHTYGVC